ncbi:unnamed protein product [Blepharisma stoltei]|uniref:RING-type domain-containing protein n=1 Tax=Blepharisma stoltei TaxID=1481888 RepID=A0AAU9JK92_9CILI|nr:unnamed protein product [Blepharisma stoltei]
MDLDVDLSIKVPVELILKEFECPVCFEHIKDACLTKCGHVFCKECIEECLNRRHECPNCKMETSLDQIVRNFHLDGVLKLLLEQREKAAKEFYDQILNQVIQRSDSVSRNPIETVFQENMRESLLAFEKYYDDLKERNERMKNKLRAEGIPEYAEKAAELDMHFNRSIDLIVEGYEKHMKSIAPSPVLLPIRLFLKVPKKNLTLDVHIPRTHTTRDLEQIIVEHYNSKGDQVQEFGQGNYIVHQAVQSGENDFIIIENPMDPIGKLDITPGSAIFFDGNILLKSDAPKQCFTLNFQKGQGMKTNYYHCSNCGISWICEPCAQSCHVGHNVKIAIPSHEPSWACCYCVKKGRCVIPNNKK